MTRILKLPFVHAAGGILLRSACPASLWDVQKITIQP